MNHPHSEAISMEKWPRAEVFQFFSGLDNPFFSVTFTVDVTNLKQYSKTNRLSFYYALVYLCAKALDRVDAFHYTIHDGALCRLETRWPSFTDLKPGSEQFHIVSMPCEGSLSDFCQNAKARSLAQTEFIRMDIEGEWLFYCSCLPWLPLTALTDERPPDPDDAIPRLSWGKYTEQNGRYTLGMSMTLNHRFVDGYHIGQFYQALCELMDNLE